MDYLGIKIIESPLCEMRVPIRKHKKRRNQTLRYHARIQKKWTKRFGLKTERVAIVFNPAAVGMPWLGGEQMALHPKDIAIIRNFLP